MTALSQIVQLYLCAYNNANRFGNQPRSKATRLQQYYIALISESSYMYTADVSKRLEIVRGFSLAGGGRNLHVANVPARLLAGWGT